MKKVKDKKVKLLFTFSYTLLIALLCYFEAGCIFKRFLGIPCPGCGLTRAIICALRLDFSAAFGYHFMFWSVPLMYLYFLYDGNLFKNKVINRLVFSLIAFGFIVNWAYRLFA